MAEEIGVNIEIDVTNSQRILADLSRQLLRNDELIAQLKKNGVSWADSFSDKLKELKERIDILGLSSFNYYKQGKNLSQTHINKIKKEIAAVAKLTKMYQQMQAATSQFKFGKSTLLDISKEPFTAHLRDPFKKQKEKELKEQEKLAKTTAKWENKFWSNIDKARLKTQKDDLKAFLTTLQEVSKTHIAASLGGKAATKDLERRKKELEKFGTWEKNFWYNLSQAKIKAQQEDLKRFIKSLQDASKSYTTASLGGQAAVKDLEKRKQALQKFETWEKNFWHNIGKAKLKAQKEDLKRFIDSLKETGRIYKKIKDDNLRAFITSLQANDISGNRVLASLGGKRAQKELEKFRKEQERIIRQQNKVRGETGRLVDGIVLKERRLTSEYLAQLGVQNKLKTVALLLKQTYKETISIANILNTALKISTYALVNKVADFGTFLQESATIASDFIGYKNALAIAAGSQEQATRRMQDAVKIAIQLKLSITAVVKEFSKFINATTLAGLSIEKATNIFKDYAIAARVLNLNEERTSSMFLALEQMVSKGTVSMEELRRQLGDHLPGALNLAAQAMGYSKDKIGEFVKAVSQGKIKSLELVEALGELVKKKTSPYLTAALDKYTAKIQHLQNAITLLKEKIGKVFGWVVGGGAEFIGDVLFWFNKFLPNSATLGAAFDSAGNAIVSADGYLQDWNKDLIASQNETKTTAEKLKDFSDQMKIATSELNVAQMSVLAFTGIIATNASFNVLKMLLSPLNKIKDLFIAIFGLKIASKFRIIGTAFAYGIDIIKNFPKYIGILRLALAGLMDPLGWLAIGFTAISSGLFYFLVHSKKGSVILKVFDNHLIELTDSLSTYSEELDNYLVKASKVQNFQAIDQITQQQQELEKIHNRIVLLANKKKALEQSLGTIEKYLAEHGYYTENAKQALQFIQLLDLEIQALTNYEKTLKTSFESTKNEIDDQVKSLNELLKKYKEWSDNSESYLLDVKINIVGLPKSQQKEILIRYKAVQIALQRIAKEAQNAADINKIMSQEMAKAEKQIQLERLQRRIKDANDSTKKFDDTFKKLFKTISDGTRSTKQEKEQIGLSSFEIERLKISYEQETLDKQISELATKALTKAQRAQIETLKQALALYVKLRTETLQQKEAEDKRKKTLEELTRQQEDFNKLRLQGFDLIKEFLPLEQQYALQIEEIDKKLKAYGATAEQIKKVHRKVWKDILANAKETQITLEDVTKQLAEKMQSHFSDFFFDVMQGKFENMADSFKQALDRMVADAMAANLTKYLMGQVAPSGSFDGILGSIVSGLFGVNQTATPPSTGISFTTAASFTGGAFPQFATGGEFRVGGTGGTDSQIVAFRASPNEIVSIKTPSQQKQENKSQVINITMNISTPNADSFMQSKNQILNDIKLQMQHAGRLS